MDGEGLPVGFHFSKVKFRDSIINKDLVGSNCWHKVYGH